MASVIPGYEYDIFISYRQKDNKGERWVSEFVDALRNELDATFKEEVSVYFDINPHDGLLESHDVDASLKVKLKCLVFIPVISRTYCDPKAFAWINEFQAFTEQASGDKFGLRISLLNGNVACRVLPVRIHDLEYQDLKLCEGLLGGTMRCIDFVYRAPGVNRPLRANEDHPHDNINKIYYRDQINKVANAVDEIIDSMKYLQGLKITENNLQIEHIGEGPVEFRRGQLVYPRIMVNTQKDSRIRSNVIHRFLSYYKKYAYTLLIIIPIFAIIFGWIDLPNIFKKGKARKEQAEIHASYAKNYCDNNEFEAAKREVALTLQLDPVNSSALTTLAAVSFKEGDLSGAIRYTLEALKSDPDNSTAAYNLALAFDDSQDYHQAVEWYLKSIGIDSSQVPAYSALGRLYNILRQPADAVLILSLAQKKYPDSEYLYLVQKNLGNSYLLMNQPEEAIRYLEQSLSRIPNQPEAAQFLAEAYEASGQITKSIELWQKYIKLETDTLKANEAYRHLKEITILHLQEIIK